MKSLKATVKNYSMPFYSLCRKYTNFIDKTFYNSNIYSGEKLETTSLETCDLIFT